MVKETARLRRSFGVFVLTVFVALSLSSAIALDVDKSVPAAVAVEGPPLYPLKDIKPGQRAKGHTVFSSSRGPEPFEAEILGVMRGYLGPGEDLIIARLVGEQIERTGVISGMSGSPVYIDGKLVGAVGYRFGQFTKDAIAGITPIERMMTGAPAPTAQPGKKAALADTPWGKAQPIAMPIMLAGLSTDVAATFSPMLEERGYGPLFASGGAGVAVAASGAANAKAQRFYASGPIAGLIVDGDIKMAGIGTVTWVKGDRFLGFGHPFMGTGVSSMPVSNANIVTTVASSAGSWKMGQATTPVGRLTDDRLHAIAGTMGEAPRTIPVSLEFSLPSARKEAELATKLSFTVMDHPTDTPLFSAIAIANSLSNRVNVEGGGTFDIAVTAKLSTGDTVTLPARFADDTASPAIPTALAVLAGLSQLLDSDFQKVALQSVSVKVTGRTDVEMGRVVNAQIVGAVRAGDKVDVVVRVLPWRKKETQHTLTVQVPRGLAPGTYNVVVASPGSVSRIEREGGLISTPRTFAQELALITRQPPPGMVSVYLVREKASPRLDGVSMPGVPASLVELTGGGGGLFGSGSVDAQAMRLARHNIGAGVVVGEAIAKLTVTE